MIQTDLDWKPEGRGDLLEIEEILDVLSHKHQDRIPEENGDLVETEEILDAMRQEEMLTAEKSMLEETEEIQEKPSFCLLLIYVAINDVNDTG